MKHLLTYCSLAVIVCIAACHNAPDQPQPPVDNPGIPTPVPDSTIMPRHILNHKGDSLILQTSIDTPLTKKTLTIEVRDTSTLTGIFIVPPQSANIRFEQVFDPQAKPMDRLEKICLIELPLPAHTK